MTSLDTSSVGVVFFVIEDSFPLPLVGVVSAVRVFFEPPRMRRDDLAEFGLRGEATASEGSGGSTDRPFTPPSPLFSPFFA